jgi:predicted acyl esterase
MRQNHPFDDEYWATKRPDLVRVEVPTFIIASWSDQGLHTRGTLAAFEQISSREKYLLIHGRKKWSHFHDPSTFEQQRAFFDRFLKGEKSTAAGSWPKVRYELRTAYNRGVQCTADAWPIPGRTLRSLHLDVSDGRMTESVVEASASVRSDAKTGEITFEHVFDKTTDVVGGAALHLWIAAADADDADIFIGLKKLDKNGAPVDFAFANTLEKGPVALGWLRASHRELDQKRSTADRPWHLHQGKVPLVRGEPTLVVIEIWPSGTRFETGERLQLVIRGSDLYTKGMFSRHEQTPNVGVHQMFSGGDHDSHLVLGVLDDAREAHTAP